jgi:hypothetical protein
VKNPLPYIVAFAWGCVVAVGAYAALRGLQFVFFPDANPATVVWSAHAGYFWRALSVGYAGGAAAFVAFFLARRNLARVARGLLPALTIAGALIFAQGVLLP